MRFRLCAALSVVAAMLPATAYATISEALSLDDLVHQADHIVLVTCEDEHARRDARDRIVTDFTVRIEEVMKGHASVGTTVVMTQLGGVMGDLGMRIEGEPHLETGTRYVLFLRTMRDGHTLRPVGMSQGVMQVEEQHGTPTVMPGGGGLALVQRVAGGQLAPAPAALIHPEPYGSLRARLGTIIDRERAVGP